MGAQPTTNARRLRVAETTTRGDRHGGAAYDERQPARY